MVRIKNIVKDGRKILCDVVLENCKTPISMVYDVEKDMFERFDFPKGYEYCTEHISNVRYYFKMMIKNGEPLPNSKTIAWY